MSSTEEVSSLSPAEKYYRNHLKNVSNYQKRNPEKMREKNKKHNDKIKIEDPDKYQARLERSRNYYKNVVKPKVMASKQQSEEQSAQ